jgi:hypothetical protein
VTTAYALDSRSLKVMGRRNAEYGLTKLCLRFLCPHSSHYEEPCSQLKDNGLFERIFRLNLQGRSSLCLSPAFIDDFLPCVFFGNEDGNMFFRNVG